MSSQTSSSNASREHWLQGDELEDEGMTNDAMPQGDKMTRTRDMLACDPLHCLRSTGGFLGASLLQREA